ncbi:hypothetical protein CFC21_085961 [Triticum aestivum]|uniref:Nitrate reductase n=2 Tax=Triticum aestivum TaxID=4565 RepID=A0A9R1IE68_WHEAT|nr:nitrate reductase [NADH]-like [Triticum aestivum]KAF7082080.1 hypothetical protein CFC21_085961 [Triticum aestivum]
MAASVEPRQSSFGRLDAPATAPPARNGSSNGGIRRRADSPVRGCGFPPLISPPRKAIVEEEEQDEEDEEPEEDWREAYGSQLQLEVEPSTRDPRDEGTADAWIDRNPSLIRLTGKHPLNCEPPLARLMHHGFITPAPLHYVRNHGAVPKGDWATWTVEVTGLVRRPARLTMDELANGFAAAEVPATLVCAGNRRKEQNMVQQTVGFNWGAAGVSTSVWRGARLREVLLRCGIMSRKGQALNVCFEGAEDLPGGGGSKYGTSVTREWALDPSRDILLAYAQNGEPLLPDHGFPVRVLIPGCIGGRMVKWLRRIVVTTAESDNYYHFKDNRVLPSHVDAELANAEAWWYRPEYIINELNTNSVITTPGHDEILPINAFTTQRAYTMKGYAYSGGGKKITRVEVTLDGGESWMLCTLDIPEKPNKYGRYWCWCFWSVEIEVLDLLGAKEVAVRAWDQTHNTQPEKLIWNLMGMMNNCWFKVKVNVCRPHKGEIGLVFEHPTQPGNQTGGWMARQKHLETAEAAAPGLKRSTSTPFMNTVADKQFTMSEVRKHGSKESAWIVVHGHVYDCTAFLKDHPGGADSILINAGSDCTEEFDAIHSDKAKALLDTYRIGELITTGTGYNSDNSVHGGSSLSHLAPIREATKVAGAPIALSSPREKVPCRLVDKKELSHDVRLFRFALPSSDQVLGLPVGKHIFVCATIDGKLCMRAYTPTSMVDEIGQFELLVKVYFKDEHPKFPSGGLMTQYLESLQLGSCIDVKGPLGHVEYTGRGNFVINGKQRRARRLAMICGGSGITPMYQVIQAVLRDQPEDETEMHLVYANRSEDDILLRDELDRWAAEYPERLKVWYVIDQVKRPEDGWRFSVGFVTEDILRAHVPEGGDDTLALACGPPPMIKFAISPNLEKMKYDMANSFISF